METITLELLREGSPEGQVLSGLTRYFALCGNQAPEAFGVPLAHLDFVRRREALRHAMGDSDPQRAALRHQAIEHLQRDVSQLVASLRCLAHELSAAPSGGEPVHLRVVMTPLELAALPLELALGANGMPGAGLPLSTQRERPVVITRESRRVPPRGTAWPTRPKVLFAWCEPETDDGRRLPVPWKAHLLALVKALRPWLDAEGKHAAEVLQVIGHATLEQLRERCAKERFTHVHLLAHGVERAEGSALERAYDLAFEGPGGRLHRVDGSALSAALSAGGRDDHGPAVVTVASCDTAQVGSILGGDASVVHRLHADGIPLVVGAQLPLSFKASVILTEVLYDALLRGGDPRDALHVLRRRLVAESEHPWEWAAVVAYASLPADLEAQLDRVAFAREKAAINLTIDARREAQQRTRITRQELAMLDRNAQRVLARTRGGDIVARADAHDFLGSMALRWVDLRLSEKDDATADGPRVRFTFDGQSGAATDADHDPRVSTWDLWTAVAKACGHFGEVHRLAPERFWAANVANELEWFIHGRYDQEVDFEVRLQADRQRRSEDPAVRENARVTLFSIDLMHVLLYAEKGRLRYPWRWKRSPSQSAWDLLWSVMRKGGPRSHEALRLRRVAGRFRTWVAYLKGQRSADDACFDALITLAEGLTKKFDTRSDFVVWPESEAEGKG